MNAPVHNIDAAFVRMANVAAEIEIARARLRGDLEHLFRLAGMGGVQAAVQGEMTSLAARAKQFTGSANLGGGWIA